MHEQPQTPASDLDQPEVQPPCDGLADDDAAMLRDAVQRAYALPVAVPRRPLMVALLPLRRQHMTARPLQRGVMRQLLGMFLFRPVARVFRIFQVLTGRVERV